MTGRDLDQLLNTAQHSQVSKNPDPGPNELTPRQRWITGVSGILVFGAGVYGIFKTNSTVGVTTLAIIGAGVLVITAIGQWPDQFTVGGNGMDYSRPSAQTIAEKEIESEIESAPTKDLPDLKKIQKAIISSGENVGRYSFVEYDQQFQLAIRRLFPKARLIREARVGQLRVDYLLQYGEEKLLLETKFLKPGHTQFKGVTLDFLAIGIPPNSKLLVVANVEDIEIARKKLKESLPEDRGRVISWRGPEDDDRLAEAIRRMVPGISK